MFVLKPDQSLEELKPANFEREEDFQKLLMDFPQLLAGDQIDSEIPRQWILVDREMPVSSEEDGAERWYADHLFIDQDSIPTIVEVKRQSDTRLRREVVGQMLDYAANGSIRWKVEEIKARFESKHPDHEQRLSALLGSPDKTEGFWDEVKKNLQAGKIRMLFVADRIPGELKAIVEFLNKQMNPAEILALELQQFEGTGGLKTIVPRLFGQTQEAQQKKGVNRRDWDNNSFWEAFNQLPEQNKAVARKIADWMEKKGAEISFGRGQVGSLIAAFTRGGSRFPPLSLLSNGKVCIKFGDCRKSPFDDDEKRREWWRKLNQGGIGLSEDAIDKWPSISLDTFKDNAQIDKFLEAMNWFVSELPRA